MSNRRGATGQDVYDVYLGLADGSAPAELVLDHTFGVWEAEFTRDGKWLVMRTDEPEGGGNIYARQVGGDTALVPIVTGKDLSVQIALSPDGRWLAYTGNESGRPEVYVTSFPDLKVKRLISRDGGTEPRWANSGRELFFKSGGQFVVVDVTPGPSFASSIPRPLFPVAGFRSARNRPQYDISPDDRRFLMIHELGGDTPSEVVYVENWFQELEAKTKVKR
jgi:dipeptidyl aminopeptidase/acylaminoacyl peptidase